MEWSASWWKENREREFLKGTRYGTPNGQCPTHRRNSPEPKLGTFYLGTRMPVGRFVTAAHLHRLGFAPFFFLPVHT